MLKRLFLVGCALLLISGCASPPEKKVSYDWTAIFANYHAWQWLDGKPVVTDALIGADLTDSFVRRAVTKELERKGMRLTMKNPDLLINYRGNFEQSVSSEPGVSGYSYAWRWSKKDSGEWEGRSLARGTLVIEMIDSRTKNLVWSGSISDAVTDPSQMQSQIPAAVRAILDAYPPKVQ